MKGGRLPYGEKQMTHSETERKLLELAADKLLIVSLILERLDYEDLPMEQINAARRQLLLLMGSRRRGICDGRR